VSFAEKPLDICKDFLSAAEKFDKERGPLDDTSAFFSCNGYGVRKSHLVTCIIY
jgi:alcohol oxidase